MVGVRARGWLVIAALGAGCRFGFDEAGRRDSGAGGELSGGDPDAGGDGATDGSVDASGEAGLDALPVCPVTYNAVAGQTSLYRAVSSTSDWLAAEQACEADGAHLAVIDTAAEKASLVALLPGQNAWTGVTDRKVVGQWLKVTGGTATYLPWDVSEPDAANLECVQLDGVTTLFGDQGCSSGRRYICECDGAAALASTY